MPSSWQSSEHSKSLLASSHALIQRRKQQVTQPYLRTPFASSTRCKWCSHVFGPRSAGVFTSAGRHTEKDVTWTERPALTTIPKQSF